MIGISNFFIDIRPISFKIAHPYSSLLLDSILFYTSIKSSKNIFLIFQNSIYIL